MGGITESLQCYHKRVKYWMSKYGSSITGKLAVESNTAIKFVIPLLEILGWDSCSENLEFEHHFKSKEGKCRHADIALYVKDLERPKILFEVKRIQADLHSGTKQIFRYLVGSKVTYGVVTNGRELELFCRRYVRHDYKRATLLFRLKVEDFIQYRDVLFALSKNSIESGILDRLSHAYNEGKYWKRREFMKNGDHYHDKYELPLLFARQFLKDEQLEAQKGIS